MARNEALVTIVGWLNDVKDFEWGRALKVAVDVRKKNHQGEWETVDKTLYDVTTDLSDHVYDPAVVKQVEVEGRITGTSVYEKRDGSTGFSIKVRATHVAPVLDKVNEAAINSVWPSVNPSRAAVDESAPF
jgi:hypothetical protein